MSQTLEPSDQGTADPVHIDTVKVIRTELLVVLLAVGEKYPVGCIAAADDGHNTLAMLKGRKGESLAHLLIRLDQAILKANDEGIFTDEINLLPKSSRQ